MGARMNLYRPVVRELGQRLAHHRAARQLTRGALARRCGVPERHLAAIERGRADVRIITVIRICDVLNLMLSDLFRDSEVTPPRTSEVRIPSHLWQTIGDGTQSFLLLRDERVYRAGDRVTLVETMDGQDTGRWRIVELTYLLYGTSVGLAPGCVVASIAPARDAWVTAAPRRGA